LPAVELSISACAVEACLPNFERGGVASGGGFELSTAEFLAKNIGLSVFDFETHSLAEISLTKHGRRIIVCMNKTVLSVAALALLLGYAAVPQAPAGPRHHVVFQVNEPDAAAWGSLVLHVNNTMKALADDGGSQVEVVFYGFGLNMLAKTNTAYEAPLKQLSDNGVKLVACRNAMKVRNVKTEDLFPFTVQVDSGIAEMVRKQEAGWAYIH
jgi:intracellular sulfur oxidation DsrE/DsrF family protein